MWAAADPCDPGFTYDGKTNVMLGPSNRIRGRVDRVLGKLRTMELDRIQLVGTSPLPGVTYQKATKAGNLTLPVLPSDHYGILAIFKPV